MKVWRVYYKGNAYETTASTAAKAINNVRYRERLLFAAVGEFEAVEA